MRTKEETFAGRARRRQAVSAAIDVLAEEGFAATSIGNIAARLDVSKGVLTYHFDSKAELLREVVRAVLADAEAWMIERTIPAASYRQALHAYIDSNLSYLVGHPRQLAALTEVLSNVKAVSGLAQEYDSYHRKAIQALIDIFAGGQRAGEFGEVSATVLATSLRATIDSVTALLRTDPTFGTDAFGRDLRLMFDHATGASLRPIAATETEHAGAR